MSIYKFLDRHNLQYCFKCQFNILDVYKLKDQDRNITTFG